MLTACDNKDITAAGSEYKNTFAAIVAPNTYVLRVGQGIMELGGNAFDAAIAMGFVASVTAPAHSGLAATGACMVRRIQENTKTEIFHLDFRKDFDKDFGKSANVQQALYWRNALAKLHALGGSLPWQLLLEPAYIAARDGFLMGTNFINDLNAARDKLSQDPKASAVFIDDQPALTTDLVFRQQSLADLINDISAAEKAKLEGWAKEVKEQDALLVGFNDWRVHFADGQAGDGQDASFDMARLWLLLSQNDLWRKTIEAKRLSLLLEAANLLKQESASVSSSGGTDLLLSVAEINRLQGLLVQGLVENVAGSAGAARASDSGLAASVYASSPEDLANFAPALVSQILVVDQLGQAVVCGSTLGASFGQGKMDSGGAYFLNAISQDNRDADRMAMVMADVLVVKDVVLPQHAFIGAFAAGGGKRASADVAQVMARVLLEGHSLKDASKMLRVFPVVSDPMAPDALVADGSKNDAVRLRRVFYESGLAGDVLRDFRLRGFISVQTDKLAHVDAIFCSSGVPLPDLPVARCLAQGDTRGSTFHNMRLGR